MLEFFRRQLAGLGNDVFGHRDLTDVVQQRRGAQRFHLRLAEAQFFGDLDGVSFDALQMIVRGLVLGFDGDRQRLDGAAMQRGDFFGVRALILGAFFRFLQPADVQAMGAVDHVEDRHQQQSRLPSRQTLGDGDDPGRGRAHQIIRESPEVGIAPDLSRRSSLRSARSRWR